MEGPYRIGVDASLTRLGYPAPIDSEGTMTEKLKPTQIGYLRNVPEKPALILGPRKAMARKFVPSGLVAADGPPGHFRRTPAGSAAVEAFDAGLSPALLDLLRRVRDGAAGAGERGLDTLVRADLVWVGMRSGENRPTSAGLDVLSKADAALSHASAPGSLGPR